MVEYWQVADTIVARAESQFGRLYDLVSFNCEHFVTLALGLEPQSKQLLGWLVLSCLVVAAVVHTNSQQRR